MQKQTSRTVSMVGMSLASVYFLYCVATPSTWHFIDGVNLIFHEAGHTIFSVLGIEFIAVAGGTLMQLLIPFGIAAYFWKSRQVLSSMITLMWGGQSLLNVYIYASDAQNMALELLGGGDSIHDWNYMLRALDILSYTKEIATLIHMTGSVCIIGAILYAGYLLFSPEWNSKELR